MRKTLQVLLALLVFTGLLTQPVKAQSGTCEYWVATTGNNANPGTNALPWATIDYASSQALKLGGSNCTVWVKDGIYNGITDINERFATATTFKSLNPYKAILQNTEVVVKLSGAKNITFEGFEMRQSSTTTSGAFVIYGSMSGGVWGENITFRNNIIHDAYNQDLVKFTSGVKFITLEGNVLYNQGPNEEHMDINSVSDVNIQDNIFFNDFEGSNRINTLTSKHFIIVKDSSGTIDGMLGAQRVTIRRNIFMHFQGGKEGFVQIGNDGKEYYEAIGVRVENNMMIGDGQDIVSSVFGAAGVKDVTFVNNTVTGNHPASSFAFRVVTKGSNLQNQNITFYNNIWADPTGTMNKFSAGTPSMTTGLALDNNLYWNGGAAIPNGDLISPTSDSHRVVAEPKLNPNQSGILLPRWDGTKFKSGGATIRQEFLRLVNSYGSTSAGSVAIDKANPSFAPSTDILGQSRGTKPDLGAYENTAGSVVSTNTNTAMPSATFSLTTSPSQTPAPTKTLTPASTLSSTSTATQIQSPSTPTQIFTYTPATTATVPSNTPIPSITPITPSPTATNTSIATAFPPSATATVNKPPTVTASVTNIAAPDPIFKDDFESGNVSTWSSSLTDGLDLSVLSTAIPNLGKGLKAEINDVNLIYLTDSSPNSEAGYRARFYFDPNSISMKNNESFTILAGYAGTSKPTSIFQIEFGLTKGKYNIRINGVDDKGNWLSSVWVRISDEPHSLEISWKASVSTNTGNGEYTLWIDGKQKTSLTSIDNDTRRVDEIRIGVVDGLDNRTRGIIFFDGFISRRQSYIGP